MEKKYQIKIKKPSNYLFLQKHFGCPELGENRIPKRLIDIFHFWIVFSFKQNSQFMLKMSIISYN